MMCAFEPEDRSWPPYRIENRTSHEVRFQQLSSASVAASLTGAAMAAAGAAATTAMQLAGGGGGIAGGGAAGGGVGGGGRGGSLTGEMSPPEFLPPSGSVAYAWDRPLDFTSGSASASSLAGSGASSGISTSGGGRRMLRVEFEQPGESWVAQVGGLDYGWCGDVAMSRCRAASLLLC